MSEHTPLPMSEEYAVVDLAPHGRDHRVLWRNQEQRLPDNGALLDFLIALPRGVIVIFEGHPTQSEIIIRMWTGHRLPEGFRYVATTACRAS